jgi:hypothetical protein
MQATQENAARADYRSEALVCAISTCASVTADLLARHPRSAELKRHAADYEGKPLGKLLWQELVEEERACLGPRGAYYVDPAEGTACQYWQRRARLGVWKQRRDAAGRLPAPWPKLLEMPAAAARQLCIAVGTEMVVRAYAKYPLQKLIPQLGPLGPDVAGQVIERLRKGTVSALPGGVTERWRDAYARMARDVAGERIVAGLGLSLLAVLFRRLPDEARAAAGASSRSKLPEALNADAFLEPPVPDELGLAQALVQALSPRGSDRLATRGVSESRGGGGGGAL